MAEPVGISWETVGPAHVAPAADPVGLVTDVLKRNVTVGGFIDRAASDDETVVLIVNDPHRATCTRVVVSALASFTAGCRRAPRFRALVATGTHSFGDTERRAFERSNFANCGLDIKNIAWHGATNRTELVTVGRCLMHEWLGEARYLLPIGSVEPHYFAGVTGAHKTVTIGCMAREDIERNHALALSSGSDILSLEGNPVYDDVVGILGELTSAGKLILAINVVMRSSALVAAAAGGALDTLRQLLPAVHSLYLREVAEPVDLLRLRVPLPLGRNLYQADKALKNNHWAVRDKGGILLEAPCPDGVGPDGFLDLLQETARYDDAVRRVRREGYRLGDHKALKLCHLMDPRYRGVLVALVSSKTFPQRVESAGIRPFRDVAPALDWLTQTVPAPIRQGLIVEDAACVTVAPSGRGRDVQRQPRTSGLRDGTA
ncbi:MAG: lactate racemase domain-containing protein [Phycisphaerae bacterium]